MSSNRGGDRYELRTWTLSRDGMVLSLRRNVPPSGSWLHPEGGSPLGNRRGTVRHPNDSSVHGNTTDRGFPSCSVRELHRACPAARQLERACCKSVKS